MFLINCFVIITTYVNLVSTESTYCGNWDEFGEQNCIKVIDKEKLVNYENAVEMCAQTENSHLITIKSENKQKFLENYLFKDKQIVDNVWIGLRNENGFKWSDKSSVDYTNWADKSPINNTDIKCVQMSPEMVLKGKWINENCNRKAVVICEKTIDIKKLIEENKNFRKEIEELKKLKNCENKVSEPLNALISRIKQFHSLYNISKPFTDFDNKQRVLFNVWLPTRPRSDPSFNICESLDSNIMEIRSKQKQEIVDKHITEWGLENLYFWLNAKSDSSGKFRWSSDEMEFNYTNWQTGYPKSFNKVGYVAYIYLTSMNKSVWEGLDESSWIDLICEHKLN